MVVQDAEATERDAEIDRVNRWADRLEAVWEAIITNEKSPLAMKVEYVHKFVDSFNKLSKARRDLQGLDKPKRLKVDADLRDDSLPVSIDGEVEKLTKSLALNDKSNAGN